jgi:hypothetical protein
MIQVYLQSTFRLSTPFRSRFLESRHYFYYGTRQVKYQLHVSKFLKLLNKYAYILFEAIQARNNRVQNIS